MKQALNVLLVAGIFIGKIASGSAAAKENNIFVGDRVVSVSILSYKLENLTLYKKTYGLFSIDFFAEHLQTKKFKLSLYELR